MVELLNGNRHDEAGDKKADAEAVPDLHLKFLVGHKTHERPHKVKGRKNKNSTPQGLDGGNLEDFRRVRAPQGTRQRRRGALLLRVPIGCEVSVLLLAFELVRQLQVTEESGGCDKDRQQVEVEQWGMRKR